VSKKSSQVVPLQLRFPLRPGAQSNGRKWVNVLYGNEEHYHISHNIVNTEKSSTRIVGSHSLQEKNNVVDAVKNKKEQKYHRENKDKFVKKTWQYIEKDKSITHNKLGKKVLLSNLDRPHKIRRLLTALESDVALEVDAMMMALNKACKNHWNCSIAELLLKHEGELKINW